MNNTGFFLNLYDIENNNIEIKLNNYRNGLFIHVLSYDIINKTNKKGNYNKAHKKRLSLKRIE